MEERGRVTSRAEGSGQLTERQRWPSIWAPMSWWTAKGHPRLSYNFTEDLSPSTIYSLREHLPGKKMFSFGHCPNEGGGEGLARIKKYTLYIPLWRPKKMYKLPERRGGGGEEIWAMPERKHSFLHEVFPKIYYYQEHKSSQNIHYKSVLEDLPNAKLQFTLPYWPQPHPIKFQASHSSSLISSSVFLRSC